jgi:hypothetical protein
MTVRQPAATHGANARAMRSAMTANSEDDPVVEHRPCDAYAPGHLVHIIQVSRASNDHDENPPLPGRLLHVDEDGWLEIELDSGERVRLWNHDPDGFRIAVERNDNRVWYQERWGLLDTRTATGYYPICVARTSSPCPTGPPPDDLFDRIRERGGFLVSGEEALRYLDDE